MFHDRLQQTADDSETIRQNSMSNHVPGHG
jgi:hypothetical protein